jgi:hypothetical protein
MPRGLAKLFPKILEEFELLALGDPSCVRGTV